MKRELDVYFSIECDRVREREKHEDGSKRNEINFHSRIQSEDFNLNRSFKESLSACLFVYWQNRWVELSNPMHVHICFLMPAEISFSFSSMYRCERYKRQKDKTYLVLLRLCSSGDKKTRLKFECVQLGIGKVMATDRSGKLLLFMCVNRTSQGVSHRCKLGYFNVQHIFFLLLFA